MKSSILVVGALSLLSLLYTAFYPPVNAEKEGVIVEKIFAGIDQLHFSPLPLDDAFSEKAYTLYLDRIDSRRRFLLQTEIDQLATYSDKLDDEVTGRTYQFFNLSLDLLTQGRERAKSIYKDLLAQPFDYTISENVEFDSEKVPFAKTEDELRDNWRRYLKYRVVTSILDKMEAHKKKEEADKEEKNFDDFEKEARDKVREDFDKWFKRLDKIKRIDRLSNYLNSLTNVIDPHSSYFEPRDKENFDISMSGTLEGIGARLMNEDDMVKVSSIVVGGPAWKQKELEQGDFIIKVGQAEEEPVDITGWTTDDAVGLIRGKKGTLVKLTVRKVDGSIKTVPIERDVVILEEGYAKGAVLNMPGVAENIGYIYLPKFYADFNRNGGSSCSEDVKKLLGTLKGKNVGGIILDLRSNGGGSLRDVVKMSGYFIDEGPIVQVKARGREPIVLEDEDPAVIYDGPLVVMVNKGSASASEILAAALQDYDRAVIVGSPNTFGKGTVQRFFDLDRTTRDASLKPLGEVKLTIQKFYRVNGGSTQLKGVESDIVLPDNWHYITTGERENDHAMEWTEIEPVEYEKSKGKVGDIASIQKNSQARIAASSTFGEIDKNARRLKAQRDITNYPLNFEEYSKLEKQWEAEADLFEDLFSEIPGLGVANLPGDMEYINADSSRIARNDEWIKGLRKDVYLEETLHVMKEIIK